MPFSVLNFLLSLSLVATSLIDLIRLLKLQMQLALEYILILMLCGTIRYLNGGKNCILISNLKKLMVLCNLYLPNLTA